MQNLKKELAEFRQALANNNSDREITDEFGDCLFSLVNIGRKLGISSEMALLGTVHKFRTRFAYIETQATLHNKKIEDLSLAEMDQLWEQAKQFLKHQDIDEKQQFK